MRHFRFTLYVLGAIQTVEIFARTAQLAVEKLGAAYAGAAVLHGEEIPS